MVTRYLSMDAELMKYACWLDKYGLALSPEQQYKYLFTAIPKRRSGYIKYIAKKKKV